MRMRGTVRTTALAAAVVAVVGACLVSPGTAYADSPNIYTTDPNRAGMAYFLSSLNNSDREQIAVYDRRSSDKYAVVAFLWARQNDGSWVRRMKARASNVVHSDFAYHNIDEGRRVRLMVCLEEGDTTQVYCNTWEGTA
jgi:hypothetical protein